MSIRAHFADILASIHVLGAFCFRAKNKGPSFRRITAYAYKLSINYEYCRTLQFWRLGW